MTAKLEILQATFRCDRYGLIPVRGCLRRQTDRQESTRKGELGPPRRPFCAESCNVGAFYRGQARDFGIPLEPCPACGSALIGPDAQPCETCAARRLDAGKDVPRGSLPAAGPGTSSRIWNGEAPDVPICAPGERRVAGALAARGGTGPSSALREKREARAAQRRQALEQEQDHQEQPAEPAEERRMACKECESKTVHKGWCTLRPGGPMKGAAGVRPAAGKAKPRAAEAPTPAKDVVETLVGRKRPAPPQRGRAIEEPDFAYMADEKTDDLVASVGKCKATLAALRAELLRRKTAIDAAIAEVGEDAAA